jgi:hypothetical protein
MIENKELKYAFGGIAVILIWFLWAKDKIAPFLSSQEPFIAAIIYHLGIYVGIYMLSNLLVSKFSRIKFSVISILILAGLDIVDAPYIVDKMGNFNTSVEYWYTTYDALFGSLLSNFFSGTNLWNMVYIVVPILLIVVIPILIANPKAIKNALN